MLSAAGELLETHGSVAATAELAEALGRHRAGDALVRAAVGAVFSGPDGTDPDAVYARWWLAGRREDADTRLSVRDVEDARLQALAAAAPPDGKAAAMVMEVAARAAGDLVITTAEALTEACSRHDRDLPCAPSTGPRSWRSCSSSGS